MKNKYIISTVFFAFFFQAVSFFAQNSNVIVKCSETNKDYITYSKNKIKSVSTFEVSKKDKNKKKLVAHVWYSAAGCPIKSISHASHNNNASEYTKHVFDYNSLGYRTKFEQFVGKSDSSAILVYSEFVDFDSDNRIQNKKTEHHLSAGNIKYVTEKYSYHEPTYAFSVTQNERSDAQFPYSINVYKYKQLTTTNAPEYSERIYYSSPTNYTKSIVEQNISSYYISVEEGKTVNEQKINYDKNLNGDIVKETTIDLVANKKIKEIIYHNAHEYEVVNYDKQGDKINSYTERLPYSDPLPDRVEIHGYSYDSMVKKDTVVTKNGCLKIIVFDKQYVGDKIQDKVSQTLEYNKNNLIIKQDVEYAEYITEYEYEYY